MGETGIADQSVDDHETHEILDIQPKSSRWRFALALSRVLQTLSLIVSVLLTAGPIACLLFLIGRGAVIIDPNNPDYPVTPTALSHEFRTQLGTPLASLDANLVSLHGEIADLQKESRSLSSSLSVLAGTGGDSKNANNLVAAVSGLKGKIETLAKDVDALVKKPPAAAPAPPAVDFRPLEQRLSELMEAKLRPLLPSPTANKSRPLWPCDTIVVALNSANLPMHPYMYPSFEKLFVLSGVRNIDSGCRFALWVVTTTHAQEIVGLEGVVPADKFKEPLPAVQEASEDLESLAPTVPGWFAKTPPTHRKRLVVIASSECRLPAKEAPGWETLNVDAVLIQPAKVSDADPERLRAWREFCFRHQGVVVLAPPKLDVKDTRACLWLENQLYRMIYPLSEFALVPRS